MAQTPWNAKFETILRQGLPGLGKDKAPAVDVPMEAYGLDSLALIGIVSALESAYGAGLAGSGHRSGARRRTRTLLVRGDPVQQGTRRRTGVRAVPLRLPSPRPRPGRWHGSFSFPGRPRNHPGFPRHDLLRFAQDPEPRIRLRALDDHASDATLVERFSREPDAQVRRAAAADPRLSPESAARLAGDADCAVRSSARRNPALPPEVLIPLLLDEHSAEDAAQNPAIPAAAMYRMIALAAARH